jgi:hypothetical protein
MSERVRRHSVVIAFLSVVVCSGCVASVSVTVRGSIDNGVRFEIVDPKLGTPVPFDLYVATVFERTPSGQWQKIWEVAGRGSLSVLTYSETPTGLKEVIPPGKLVGTRRYRLTASGRASSRPASNINLQFAFDPSGRAVPVKDEDE